MDTPDLGPFALVPKREHQEQHESTQRILRCLAATDKALKDANRAATYYRKTLKRAQREIAQARADLQ